MHLHFSTLNVIFHFCDQFAKLSTSFCNNSWCDSLVSLPSYFLSSANLRSWDLIPSSRSLMKMRNRSGTRTEMKMKWRTSCSKIGQFDHIQGKPQTSQGIDYQSPCVYARKVSCSSSELFPRNGFRIFTPSHCISKPLLPLSTQSSGTVIWISNLGPPIWGILPITRP